MVSKLILQCNNLHLCLICYCIVNLGPRVPARVYSLPNVAAKVFHWEGPIAPDRARSPDTVNMEQCMYSDGANTDTGGFTMVIKTSYSGD